MVPFRFATQACGAPNMAAWREYARTVEALGYSALYVTDHLDAQFGPLVAAAVAAETTESLHVGTLVLNNDLRNPVVLAREIASLGLAAEGRIEVGLGAGWLRNDYEATGITYDDPRERVARLAESVGILKALWRNGETTFAGRHYTVTGARCDPRPAVAPRIIIGGGSRQVLELAAREADTVGVNTSLRSGEMSGDLAARATIAHYQQCVEWIRAAAGDRFGALELQLATYAVMVVGSRRAAIRSASMLGLPGEEALGLPVVLVGTVDELCERLLERRERWGFTNIVVPGEAAHSFAPVVARLAGT